MARFAPITVKIKGFDGSSWYRTLKGKVFKVHPSMGGSWIVSSGLKKNWKIKKGHAVELEYISPEEIVMNKIRREIRREIGL
jgi:hypothetical protein